MRNDITLNSIAPRDRTHKLTPLVAEADRHSVDFRLNDVVQCLIGKKFFKTLAKGEQIGMVIGVVEAQHRFAMGVALKTF